MGNTLEDKVAIITGGARGIGAAVSRMFAAEGATVIINDLGGGPDGVGSDLGPAQELADKITAEGGKALANGGDIADVATGQELVRTAVERFGRLDIVVNSAGILRDRMIFNMTPEDWDAVIRVHLRGHFSTVQPAAAYWRSLRRPDGNFRVINFTSISGLDGSPGQANYAAAKMGVVGLTYSLAQGLARYGVTANAIAPSAETRLVAGVPAELRAIKDRPEATDPRRSPDNVAALATYLAGDRSGWLSGRVLSSGGFEVGLYPNPEIVRGVQSEAPWTQEALADKLESEFRPVADGLPPSVFAGQVKSK
ncbi:SDR family NAD(P)-dependent oxidoreductase [Actinomadura sp. LD22]|uniref:SDR family NAD(P)-dependent oxidoreductase n=1 Tax=Actinomadura physcomitrii TaxID=2650748 RepID=A0A6I4MBH3_9ACTN|nr:SDR family NAD(P)-dependent oxidoreductase [Actinomadura physcomitrii]MWA01584.1 SDR family NAD(P)-dependent oxidoreductase [Actinomadura physcomitrii]